MTAADWLILVGAGTFLAWTIVPHWYRAGGEKAFGIPLPSYTFNGWRGTTMFSALLALVAIAWLGLRLGGIRLRVSIDARSVDLPVAGAGLLLTLLGFVVRPATGLGTASPSWALPPAALLAGIWAYGAQRKYRERRRSMHSTPTPGSGFIKGVRP
jgi:hypothetical protein